MLYAESKESLNAASS